MTINRSLITPLVANAVFGLLSNPLADAGGGVGGGGGGVVEDPLAAVQALQAAGEFAAWWDIQGGEFFGQTDVNVANPVSSAQGVAAIPDKAAFQGEETVSQWAARTGASGTVASTLPGFPGFAVDGGKEPQIQPTANPVYWHQNPDDEAMHITAGQATRQAATSQTFVMGFNRLTDAQFKLLADEASGAGSDYVAHIASGSSSTNVNEIGNVSVPLTIRLNGQEVPYATRGDLFSLIPANAYCLISVTGVNLSTWLDRLVVFGEESGLNDPLTMGGNVAFFATFPDNPALLTATEARAATEIGVTLFEEFFADSFANDVAGWTHESSLGGFGGSGNIQHDDVNGELDLNTNSGTVTYALSEDITFEAFKTYTFVAEVSLNNTQYARFSLWNRPSDAFMPGAGEDTIAVGNGATETLTFTYTPTTNTVGQIFFQANSGGTTLTIKQVKIFEQG